MTFPSNEGKSGFTLANPPLLPMTDSDQPHRSRDAEQTADRQSPTARSPYCTGRCRAPVGCWEANTTSWDRTAYPKGEQSDDLLAHHACSKIVAAQISGHLRSSFLRRFGPSAMLSGRTERYRKAQRSISHARIPRRRGREPPPRASEGIIGVYTISSLMFHAPLDTPCRSLPFNSAPVHVKGPCQPLPVLFLGPVTEMLATGRPVNVISVQHQPFAPVAHMDATKTNTRKP